jgi:hypothetical protein
MVTRRPQIAIAISIVLASAILAIAVWLLAQMHDDALRARSGLRVHRVAAERARRV